MRCLAQDDLTQFPNPSPEVDEAIADVESGAIAQQVVPKSKDVLVGLTISVSRVRPLHEDLAYDPIKS